MKTRSITFLSALITRHLLSSCQQDDPQCSFAEEDTFGTLKTVHTHLQRMETVSI